VHLDGGGDGLGAARLLDFDGHVGGARGHVQQRAARLLLQRRVFAVVAHRFLQHSYRALLHKVLAAQARRVALVHGDERQRLRARRLHALVARKSIQQSHQRSHLLEGDALGVRLPRGQQRQHPLRHGARARGGLLLLLE
jgi:hypothetical protein